MPADAAGLARGAALIRAGACVGVVTETVYGLAADATNAVAVAGIYEAKRRPGFNPLIVHVGSFAQAEALAVFDDGARTLAGRFWPGPLTLVLPARYPTPIAALATAGLATIAIRVPAHPAMRGLIEASGRPLAAPSANASGRISPTTAAHVLRSLDGRIPLVIDAGATDAGIESTIVARIDGETRILRSGPITAEQLGLTPPGASRGVEARGVEAPGQLASHYRPDKPLTLNVVHADGDTWHIGFGPVRGDATLSATGDLREAAARLFACLHDADAGDRPRIAVAPVPLVGLGVAIDDRLRRAAAPAG